MARSRFPRPLKFVELFVVVLITITGTCMVLLLGGLGQGEPVIDVVKREGRCNRTHTPDAAFSLARALCRADVPGFTAPS